MLLSQIKVDLPKNIKIKRLIPAFNSTYIAIYDSEQLNGNSWQIVTTLLHLDQNSKLINKYSFEWTNQFVMPNEHILVFPLIDRSVLTIINLKKSSVDSVPINWTEQNRDIQLFYFAESNWICLKSKNNSQVELMYFDCSAIEEGILKIRQISHISLYLYHVNEALKGNFRSLILFKSHFQKPFLVLSEVIIKDGDTFSRIRLVEFDQLQISLNYFLQGFIWQINQEQMVFVSDNCANNQILKLNLINKNIKQLKNTLRSKECRRNVLFLNDFVFMSQTDFVNGPYHNEGQMDFISLQNSTTQRKTLSNYAFLRVFQVCDHDPSILIESINQNIVRKWRMFEVKEQYMQMILHVNEDFDDDLLLDVLCLLDCI